MTTPAQNFDSGLATAGSLWTMRVADSGQVLVPYSLVQQGNTTTQWRCYIRPASKKSPKDKSGWRAPTAFSGTYESSAFHGSRVVETIYDTTHKYTTTNFYYGGYLSVWREQRIAIDPTGLEQRAVSGALSKLKNQKVNFGVAFGEYKETAEMVTSVATRIAKTVKAFRGKYPREWGQVIKSQSRQAVNGRRRGERGSGIPNSWLELQYGWNPMMADVQNSAELLSDSASGGHPFRVTVKASAKSTLAATSWAKAASPTAAGIRNIRTGNNFCYVRLDYELNSPLLATFSSLGLTNPLEIAWELAPYSFVADWFLPIGSWLGTLDADFGWRFLAGTRTLGNKYRVQGNGVVDRSTIPGDTYSGVVTSTQGVMSFNRTLYTSSPSAGLPRFKNPLSVAHTANALSLLLNAFR